MEECLRPQFLLCLINDNHLAEIKGILKKSKKSKNTVQNFKIVYNALFMRVCVFMLVIFSYYCG